jgi:two-component system, NtrC family, sensor kinase
MNAAHILVVDDEPEIAESLGDYLVRKEGYRVTRVADGRQAVEFFETSLNQPEMAIDLVLLDMRMPVMGGAEVLDWLRRHPRLQYTRVIVLTAAIGSQEMVEALSAGADDYITKPYQPQELLARVKTILRSQNLEKQLQRQSQQLAALNRVSRKVTATLAIGEVLATAVDGVYRVLGADRAAVYMAGNSLTRLHCRQVFPPGSPFQAAACPAVPVNVGAVGQAFSHQKLVHVANPARDVTFAPGLDAPDGYLVHAMLAAPLFVRGRPAGVLVAYGLEEGPFSAFEMDLFSSLTGSVSRAIEVAWLFQSASQRQRALLESRNTLQAVIDGILHPIYTINERWQLVGINQTKAAELATTPRQLVGLSCYQALFEQSQPCEHCQVAGVLADKQARRWSVGWLGEDHLPQEWDVNAYPIPGFQVDAARAVVVWQDRTEERRLESSLLQAGKLAAIGQLAAGVAHEINNPLTAINANAQMLQMVIPSDDENYESVELIAQAGERAAKVVRGLLDFARQAHYEFEGIDVNESLRQALDLVTYQFNSAQVQVATELLEDLPVIQASGQHLQSVWLNLLINARDALQSRPEDRRVTLISQLDGGGYHVQVIIQDNGRGMSPAELSHIFEPFYTTKAPGQGTGLGLATCHRIIEQHGGEINVASIPGEGATFIVRLPVQQGPA